MWCLGSTVLVIPAGDAVGTVNPIDPGPILHFDCCILLVWKRFVDHRGGVDMILR